MRYMFPDIPLEQALWRLAQYPHSNPLMRKGGREGEREGDTGRERKHRCLSCCIWLFLFPHTGRHLFAFQIFRTAFTFNYKSKAIFLWICFWSLYHLWDAVRECFYSLRLDIWTWHGPWNQVLSVSIPILFHGFGTGTLWQLQVLAAGPG